MDIKAGKVVVKIRGEGDMEFPLKYLSPEGKREIVKRFDPTIWILFSDNKYFTDGNTLDEKAGIVGLYLSEDDAKQAIDILKDKYPGEYHYMNYGISGMTWEKLLAGAGRS